MIRHHGRNEEVTVDGDASAGSREVAEVSHPDECQDWYLEVEDKSYWFRHRASCITECLRMFPPGGPVYDIGGGNGHVSVAMRDAGFEPILVEPSSPAVQNAKNRGLKQIIRSTLQDLRLDDASVSAMGAFDVVEHVEDDSSFLRTMHRLLVPDGRVYITVPAFQLLWSAYDEYVGHFRRYTIRSLTRRLQEAGFAVEWATYLYGLLPLPIFLARSTPTRLGLSKSANFEQFQREHATRGGIAVRTIEGVLRWELQRLKCKRRLPMGSSCLVVARKVASHDARQERLRFDGKENAAKTGAPNSARTRAGAS